MSELIKIESSLTMSSLEIAELTGKLHKNILADVRNMLNELGIQPADFSARYKDKKGEERECYHLPKRECLILVSGYSAVLRAKIVDRWLELEGKQQTPAITAHDSPLIDTMKALAFLRTEVEKVPGVKPAIATAQFLTAVHEATGLPVEPLRLALPTQEEPASLNPTKLGKLAGMSAKEVNRELQLSGFQFKNERGEWELTDKGKKYAEAYPFARNGHASYQILWRPKVQEFLP